MGMGGVVGGIDIDVGAIKNVMLSEAEASLPCK
jgi:hypothetical protein